LNGPRRGTGTMVFPLAHRVVAHLFGMFTKFPTFMFAFIFRFRRKFSPMPTRSALQHGSFSSVGCRVREFWSPVAQRRRSTKRDPPRSCRLTVATSQSRRVSSIQIARSAQSCGRRLLPSCLGCRVCAAPVSAKRHQRAIASLNFFFMSILLHFVGPANSG